MHRQKTEAAGAATITAAATASATLSANRLQVPISQSRTKANSKPRLGVPILTTS